MPGNAEEAMRVRERSFIGRDKKQFPSGRQLLKLHHYGHTITRADNVRTHARTQERVHMYIITILGWRFYFITSFARLTKLPQFRDSLPAAMEPRNISLRPVCDKLGKPVKASGSPLRMCRGLPLDDESLRGMAASETTKISRSTLLATLTVTLMNRDLKLEIGNLRSFRNSRSGDRELYLIRAFQIASSSFMGPFLLLILFLSLSLSLFEHATL